MQETLAMAKTEEEEKYQRHIAARLQELCDALILDAEIAGQRELTEAEIGKTLGVANAGTFSLYIRGKRGIPPHILAAAGREYGAALDWLILGDAKYNSPGFAAKLRELRRRGPPKPRRGKRRGSPS